MIRCLAAWYGSAVRWLISADCLSPQTPGCPCVSPRSLPHCGAQVTTILVVCDDPVAVGYDRPGKATAGSVHSRTIAAVLYRASDEVAVTVYVCAITASCGG